MTAPSENVVWKCEISVKLNTTVYHICKKQADSLFHVDYSIKIRKKIMGQKEMKGHLE